MVALSPSVEETSSRWCMSGCNNKTGRITFAYLSTTKFAPLSTIDLVSCKHSFKRTEEQCQAFSNSTQGSYSILWTGTGATTLRQRSSSKSTSGGPSTPRTPTLSTRTILTRTRSGKTINRLWLLSKPRMRKKIRI